MPDDEVGEVRAASEDFCYLTTFGRVSGRRREIEIWFVLNDDTMYLLAGSGRDADWVRNLDANPECEVRIGSRKVDAIPAKARLLDRGDLEGESRRARDLVYAKYQPRYEGDLGDWRERALPVALDLNPA
jgi:deazaflavin-dependent oxidoreductase (nitroreductase family)